MEMLIEARGLTRVRVYVCAPMRAESAAARLASDEGEAVALEERGRIAQHERDARRQVGVGHNWLRLRVGERGVRAVRCRVRRRRRVP